MAQNPYANLPEKRIWRNAVQYGNSEKIADLHKPKWSISRDDVFVTMGSCFAQHIGKWLRAENFNAPLFDTDRNIKSRHFSANYGNIYTVRQALQLVQEAMGERSCSEPYWETEGGYIDPLRPNIFVEPVETPEQISILRQNHLQCVRDALLSADVFIFTLGLTEAWLIRECGTVLPVAPGVLGGTYDPERYSFKNFNYMEVMADLEALISAISTLRGGRDLRVLLTLTPGHLTATAEDRHILQSAAYSKAVLRAAAGDFVQRNALFDYFPSYEIIINPKSQLKYFNDNLRTVRPDAIPIVMRHFEEAYFNPFSDEAEVVHQPVTSMTQLEEMDDVDCEEALLDSFSPMPATIATLCNSNSQNPFLFFGNSHLGFFKNALSRSSIFDRSSFAAANFLTNDPFVDLDKHKFRVFEFTDDSPFANLFADNAQYLCILGFGLFGDGILRTIGPLSRGFEGCDGKEISPHLPITHTIPRSTRQAFAKEINDRLGLVKPIVEGEHFKTVVWVVSPDLPERTARFRLGADFVDSGAYHAYKTAYREVFDEIVKDVHDIEFVFHDDETLYSKSGFVKDDFSRPNLWDIHPDQDFYRHAVSIVEQKFTPF